MLILTVNAVHARQGPPHSHVMEGRTMLFALILKRQLLTTVPCGQKAFSDLHTANPATHIHSYMQKRP